MNFFLLVLIFMIGFTSCNAQFVRNTEARDDAIEMENALKSQAQIEYVVVADVETEPVFSESVDDDAADDPAIWYNESKPEASIIFGSNKLNGIHAYNLEGKELQYIAAGKINNIDIRQDIPLGNKSYDVLCGSNRTDNSIVLYLIDEENGMINDTPDFEIDLGEFKPYGFCLYLSPIHLYAFINNKKGEILQFEIKRGFDLKFRSRQMRALKLPTQVEGMTVDDANGILFVGEEQTGIHLFDAGPQGNVASNFLKETSAEKTPQLRYDIEGLALLGSQYLIASSQGNFSFAIFNRTNFNYERSFKILEGEVDAVIETDGIEINTNPMGPKFPKGILVVQDGFNYEGSSKQAQNFKIISLEKIYEVLGF